MDDQIDKKLVNRSLQFIIDYLVPRLHSENGVDTRELVKEARSNTFRGVLYKSTIFGIIYDYSLLKEDVQSANNITYQNIVKKFEILLRHIKI